MLKKNMWAAEEKYQYVAWEKYIMFYHLLKKNKSAAEKNYWFVAAESTRHEHWWSWPYGLFWKCHCITFITLDRYLYGIYSTRDLQCSSAIILTWKSTFTQQTSLQSKNLFSAEVFLFNDNSFQHYCLSISGRNINFSVFFLTLSKFF